MITYSPQDWYWQVSGVGVYGSARAGLVSAPATDKDYVTWRAINGAGALAPNTTELDAVLLAAGLPASGLTPPTKPQLQVYASAKMAALFAIARTYSLDSGVSVKCDTTTSTGANLAALNAWGSAAANATTQWVDNSGAVTQITGAQAVELAAGVIAYGQSVYAILASAMTGISGNTITTTAQVDALAWPT